ncbi:unnamed protein product [Arabidopsis lyrata]|uniref:Predicted protein n=1 Tax=Arabidopsis lyrata subsp. lyrata TaxID=81972 RepID=D7MHF6_ARALL|nr:predicted protein [Arabidopsis lyrata subsp. lyrata]CAH8276835.1 unnamed protein product [Arabidopsis lyrata]
MSLRLVECRSGSISLQIFGSTVRRAPPPTKRSSSYFAVSSFLVFFPSRVNRLSRVKPMVVVSSTSLSGALRPLLISVVGDPLASVNRRRRMSSSSLGLGQSPTLQFQWKGFNWAWPIFGLSGGCCGPLLFGLQACFVMQTSFLACPNVVHFSPSAPTTDFVFPRSPLATPSPSPTSSPTGSPDTSSGSVYLHWILLR